MFGVPISGAPEVDDSAQALLPSGVRPFGLAKLASTIWPSGCDLAVAVLAQDDAVGAGARSAAGWPAV